MMIAIRRVIFAIGRGMAAFGLGGFILWQVAIQSGPLNGVAYVHVVAPNVEVTVDNVQYHVATSWDNPIVCELGPGNHIVRMSRDGSVLYEEKFSLGIRQQVVLVATEPRDTTSASAAPRNRPAEWTGTCRHQGTAFRGANDNIEY